MSWGRAGKENRLFNYDLRHALKEDINYGRRHSMDWDIGLKGTVGLWWPISCCYQYLVRPLFVWTSSISREKDPERAEIFWGFIGPNTPTLHSTAQQIDSYGWALCLVNSKAHSMLPTAYAFSIQINIVIGKKDLPGPWMQHECESENEREVLPTQTRQKTSPNISDNGGKKVSYCKA